MEKSEWIKWEGGDCPVPKQTGVEYETRTGSPGLGIAGDLRWDYLNSGGDIVAYRVVKEATKPVSPEDVGSAATSKHYNSKLIQPIEICQMVLTPEEFQGAMKFNIMKYTQRAGSKEGESSQKDWNKALQYKLWLELAKQYKIIDPRKDIV